MAKVVGGDPFHLFVCIDGMIVLAGSVLTAYVGVTGLMKRLALDRVLPEVFMRTNKLRGTAHWVIIGFFALTSSLFLILASGSSNGDQQMNDLSGVSISNSSPSSFFYQLHRFSLLIRRSTLLLVPINV